MRTGIDYSDKLVALINSFYSTSRYISDKHNWTRKYLNNNETNFSYSNYLTTIYSIEYEELIDDQ
jgi:hypothetical protein